MNEIRPDMKFIIISFAIGTAFFTLHAIYYNPASAMAAFATGLAFVIGVVEVYRGHPVW